MSCTAFLWEKCLMYTCWRSRTPEKFASCQVKSTFFSRDQQKVFLGSVMHRCPSLLWCSAFIDLNVLLGKRAISNLRGTTSPLNFTAGYARMPMFKPKISTCLKGLYVIANKKKRKGKCRLKAKPVWDSIWDLFVCIWQTFYRQIFIK